MHRTIGFRTVVLTLALAVGPLAQLAPSDAQTQGTERRQDRRDDRQDARDRIRAKSALPFFRPLKLLAF